ncbi:MAG: hypothetical protein LBR23_02365 [Spirochaetaceae bacterium]|jgi:hypothetical protein|nr:hypothetical protein [Spirochaetaceae bacterium]
MNLFSKICRVSMIAVLCASSLGRFAVGLPQGLVKALTDAFSFGMLITLAFGLVLSMTWAFICAVQIMRGRQ